MTSERAENVRPPPREDRGPARRHPAFQGGCLMVARDPGSPASPRGGGRRATCVARRGRAEARCEARREDRARGQIVRRPGTREGKGRRGMAGEPCGPRAPPLPARGIAEDAPRDVPGDEGEVGTAGPESLAADLRAELSRKNASLRKLESISSGLDTVEGRLAAVGGAAGWTLQAEGEIKTSLARGPEGPRVAGGGGARRASIFLKGAAPE